MFVAGIDYSTHAIDLVLVDLDGARPPWWHRFDLHGTDAWERTRQIRQAMPGPSSQLWDEVLAYGIEDPKGHRTQYLYRVQGAILACLPPSALVHPLQPSEWRRAVGLKGNASKDEVAHISEWNLLNSPLGRIDGTHDYFESGWPQDAHDAHLIALATAQLLQQQAA